MGLVVNGVKSFKQQPHKGSGSTFCKLPRDLELKAPLFWHRSPMDPHEWTPTAWTPTTLLDSFIQGVYPKQERGKRGTTQWGSIGGR